MESERMARSVQDLELMRRLGMNDDSIALSFAMEPNKPLPPGVRRMPRSEAESLTRQADEHERANLPEWIKRALHADPLAKMAMLAKVAWKVGAAQLELDGELIDVETGETLTSATF